MTIRPIFRIGIFGSDTFEVTYRAVTKLCGRFTLYKIRLKSSSNEHGFHATVIKEKPISGIIIKRPIKVIGNGKFAQILSYLLIELFKSNYCAIVVLSRGPMSKNYTVGLKYGIDFF